MFSLIVILFISSVFALNCTNQCTGSGIFCIDCRRGYTGGGCVQQICAANPSGTSCQWIPPQTPPPKCVIDCTSQINKCNGTAPGFCVDCRPGYTGGGCVSNVCGPSANGTSCQWNPPPNPPPKCTLDCTNKCTGSSQFCVNCQPGYTGGGCVSRVCSPNVNGTSCAWNPLSNLPKCSIDCTSNIYKCTGTVPNYCIVCNNKEVCSPKICTPNGSGNACQWNPPTNPPQCPR